MMTNEYCRLCSSNNNVVNIFSKELINSDKLRNYIFTCSGVNILSDDIITKYVCYTCLQTIRKIMKFRKDSINNDLKLKYILLGENNINQKKMNDIDIDDVFNFLPSLEKEPKIKEEIVNENSDLNVNSVNLDLIENNNSDEFEDSIVKEEAVVMAVGLPEDVELRKNEEEILKREFISKDGEDCLNKLNDETLNKKGEGNKLTKRENKIKNMISKISNTNKINSRSDEKSFVKKGKFINSDENKSYKCPKCGKHFRALQTFKVHRCRHSDTKSYQCTECGKCFWQLILLKRHRFVHLGKKLHECLKCKKQFVYKRLLDQHMFSHSDAKSFECLDCGKKFRQKSTLITHLYLHSGAKPHECPECGKCFRLKHVLTEHRRIHSNEKPYECLECGKKFTQKSTLIAHLNVHSGARPYECPECGKCFRHKHILIKHRRIHSNEKPYECPECGKKFTQKCNLTRHLDVHSGVKSYECPDCGKCFRQKPNLTTHRRIHSNEKPQKSNLITHLDVHPGARSGAPSMENATDNSTN